MFFWAIRIVCAEFKQTSVTGSPQQVKAALKAGGLVAQVSLLTLMVGNLLEKSLALAAILTATWRATAL